MIPVTMLEVHIHANTPIDFGANPGSALRGALYNTLRTMYDTGAPVQAPHEVENNPVAWLLALEDPNRPDGKDVPRPLGVRPPLSPSVSQAFSLAFYGRGREQIPMVLTAVYAMGAVGVGRGRHPFKVAGVEQVDFLNGKRQEIMDAEGKQLNELWSPPPSEAYEDVARQLEGKPLVVQFLTPTRIVQRGKLCHRPQLRPWVQRLLERIRRLGELYTDNPPWVPFRELLDASESVRVIKDETHWQDMYSGSRRQGRMTPTGGFVGKVTYSALPASLLPWVVLGQGIQVGKSAVKGNGWYQLIP